MKVIKTLLSFTLVFITLSSAAQWIEQSTGFLTASRGIRCVYAVNSQVIWATAYDGSGGAAPCQDVTVTSNGGGLWTPHTIAGVTSLDISNIVAINANTAWVGLYPPGATTLGQGIYKTTDGGLTWTRQATASFSNSSSFVDFVYFWDQNRGVCMGDPINGEFEIYTTTNGGATWTLVPGASIPNPIVGEYGIVGYYSSIGETTWFGTNKGRIFKSIDNGHNWTVSAITGWSAKTVQPFFRDGMNGVGADRSAASTGAMVRTTDGGATWTPIVTTGQVFTNDMGYIPGTPGTWVTTGAATGMTGVTYSFNDAVAWNDMAATIGTQFLGTDWVNDSTGWAGGFNADATTGGMYKFAGSLAEPDFTANNTTVAPGASVTFSPVAGVHATSSVSWSFPGGTPSTSSSKHPVITYNTPGVYNVTLVVTSSWGNATELKSAYITVTSQSNHFMPVWAGNPLNPMSIFVTQATLDGSNLGMGDEIGVFDGGLCVGALLLTAPVNPASPPSITTSRDDPSTPGIDGYTEGHSIVYKLWKSSTSQENTNVSHSFPYAPSFVFETFTQNETAVVALSGLTSVTQNTPLLAGWNMISFNAQPANMNLLNILQPLVSSGNLVKVIDEAGLIIQNFPWGWVNNIGNMAVTEGYYIKVAAACTLNVSGAPILAPTAIPLITGWNIMGYPGQTAQNAITALQPLINAGVLLKVIDEAGNIIQYFPWGWVNNIGNFKPGEGYYIKVLSACSITISNLKDALADQVPATRPVHFTLPVLGNPYQPMSLGLSLNPEFCKSIAPGSEIGVFDGNLCVGAFIFDGTRVSNVVITAYADDPETPELEGFTEAGSISFKLWDQEQLKELPIDIVHHFGDLYFSRLGTFVGELKDSPFPNSENYQSMAWLGNNYPNPFSGVTEIEFKVFEPCNVVLSVFSPLGIKIQEVINAVYQSGSYRTSIDAKLLSPGVWFYRLQATGNGIQVDQTHKMVVK